MRGRVARALEELAKAVRQSSDDEWEVVEAEVAEVVKAVALRLWRRNLRRCLRVPLVLRIPRLAGRRLLPTFATTRTGAFTLCWQTRTIQRVWGVGKAPTHRHGKPSRRRSEEED